MKNCSALSRVKLGGFTLIELLIAVGIIAILAAIVYPSYQDMVTRSHRAEAPTLLMTAAQELERCYTRFFAYNHNDCQANPVGRRSEGGFYQISDQSDIQATTFTLVAAPQGRQVRDSECGAFTLDHRGNRDVVPNTDPSNCW